MADRATMESLKEAFLNSAPFKIAHSDNVYEFRNTRGFMSIICTHGMAIYEEVFVAEIITLSHTQFVFVATVLGQRLLASLDYDDILFIS